MFIYEYRNSLEQYLNILGIIMKCLDVMASENLGSVETC